MNKTYLVVYMQVMFLQTCAVFLIGHLKFSSVDNRPLHEIYYGIQGLMLGRFEHAIRIIHVESNQ